MRETYGTSRDYNTRNNKIHWVGLTEDQILKKINVSEFNDRVTDTIEIELQKEKKAEKKSKRASVACGNLSTRYSHVIEVLTLF